MQIFGILAAILHLGNLKISKKGEQVVIDNAEGMKAR